MEIRLKLNTFLRDPADMVDAVLDVCRMMQDRDFGTPEKNIEVTLSKSEIKKIESNYGSAFRIDPVRRQYGKVFGAKLFEDTSL